MNFMHGSNLPMLVMMTFWIVLIIIGFYLISNYLKGGEKRDSIDILKERLAKGEIDEAEYQRLKSVLENKM
ncbi:MULTISPECIES: SHOCT domain-containing protein [Bacillaceae]|uniref:SHOCT domain-containing protein n=1 Tax=Oceanobacillus bengalensis TaxID=1435466 RepID=A0A494YRT4_9BACI|nr:MULTISPECIES: SHOCT domain-containing protein [Bacillaceae]RKQ12105.1 SHOCT domain-containing protein [Oceanobacillus bengalensis]